MGGSYSVKPTPTRLARKFLFSTNSLKPSILGLSAPDSGACNEASDFQDGRLSHNWCSAPDSQPFREPASDGDNVFRSDAITLAGLPATGGASLPRPQASTSGRPHGCEVDGSATFCLDDHT